MSPPGNISNPNDLPGNIKWPKGGGGGYAKPKPAEAAEPEEEHVAQPVVEEKPKEKPKAVLSNPKWSKAKAGFNEKVTLSVDGALPVELVAITKVDFQVFAVLPDGKTGPNAL